MNTIYSYSHFEPIDLQNKSAKDILAESIEDFQTNKPDDLKNMENARELIVNISITYVKGQTLEKSEDKNNNERG